jgi:hypothetical protein
MKTAVRALKAIRDFASREYEKLPSDKIAMLWEFRM